VNRRLQRGLLGADIILVGIGWARVYTIGPWPGRLGTVTAGF